MSNNKNMSLWDKFIQSMTKANELGREEDVMLDHDYDGIRELDNVLPPWWLYGFYITVAISIFYYIASFVFGADYNNQANEYKGELEYHNSQIAEYQKANPVKKMDVENMTAYTDAANIEAGKAIYMDNGCVACHKADLGGLVGPNLTDENWINGGGIKNVFNLITNGSKNNKTMVSYKNVIPDPEDRKKLASYILSMQGTNPEGALEAEGEKWSE